MTLAQDKSIAAPTHLRRPTEARASQRQLRTSMPTLSGRVALPPSSDASARSRPGGAGRRTRTTKSRSRSIRKVRCRSCGGAGTIAVLSDQLTAYQLAEPDAEQTALCVFVKTKEPKIEWHVAARSGDDLAEFLAKADIVGHDIADGRFYKRPGKWCSWCDYLPVCVKDEKRAKETLVKITHSK